MTPGNAMAGLPPEIVAAIRLLLETSPTASLATTDERGRPHAADVWFASDDRLRLYFVSSPDSAHARHLAREGRVALTVYARTDRPDQVHGVQIHGRCSPIEDAAGRQEAWAIYAARFPFVAAPPYRQAVEAQRFYVVAPVWLRWIDNRKGFGFKVEHGEA